MIRSMGFKATTAAGAGTDNVGTTFTGSAFNDRFTCGSGNDTINADNSVKLTYDPTKKQIKGEAVSQG